ncbi:FAD-binding protein [Gordonia sp. TBRC 11910]|uniref:FAD-binding protein n=1 Tax=Gordonia asplenii TaxID=2725283 RepID=A0A848L904_9ACTN|nr:GMC family oxidoreductase N-terminal domain-containing protein [Gordonia asplenii]NMO04068.1 FAD-binding protein [Gordonia asplenii]
MTNTFTALQQATLTAVVDTFVASVDRDDDPDRFYATKGSDLGADAAVAHYLASHLPPEQFAGLAQLLDTAAVVGLKNQPQSVREVIVGNLAGISPETRGAVAALYQLSVLFSYGLFDAEGRNPLWTGMGYPGITRQPPATPKTLTVITPTEDVTLTADVVVIGSGSGGGVAAGMLAQAGRSVIVLESGGYRNESDFVQSELVAYQNLFLRGGFFPTADGMVSLAAGGTVGGGSTVNWSNSLKTPDAVRAVWADEYKLSDVTGPEFDEHLAAVFERVKCNSGVALQNEPHHRLSDGADALGYSYVVADLNIDPDRFDPAVIGYSGMGDQTGAKQGTLRTYLQDASDAGARLIPQTRADKIDVVDGRAVGVSATYTAADGQTHRVVVEAADVVVAAGSLETPAVLLRSGIGGPAVGTGLHLHPATLVSGVYDEPQDPWHGPAMAGVMNEFAEKHDGHGYLIECVQHLPGLFTTVVPWLSGAGHKELAKTYSRRADWVILVKDRGAGTVTLDDAGNAVHHYPFSDELDRRNFREGIETAIRMQEAAGAQQIFAAGQPFAPWTRGEDLETFIAAVSEIPIGPGGIPVFSAHQMSSAKLGADPTTAVADTEGQLHDTRGVWIADASGMPTCSGVNPMISTMALARRTAANMLATTH